MNAAWQPLIISTIAFALFGWGTALAAFIQSRRERPSSTHKKTPT